jgi:plasmid stabilization system protein ParE
MPKAWSDKDERKYQHIRQDRRARGASEARAKEIAARTVNKDRRMEGRTPNTRSQGTGNPNEALENRSVDELRNRAADLNVSGRSRMRKQQLIEAIRAAGS